MLVRIPKFLIHVLLNTLLKRKQMKVRFLKSISGNGFHYRKNAVVEFRSSEQAIEFLNAGFCVVVEEPAKKRAKKAVKKPVEKQTR